MKRLWEAKPRYHPETIYRLYAVIDLEPSGIYTAHVLKRRLSGNPKTQIWYSITEDKLRKRESFEEICRSLKCPQMLFYRRVKKLKA